MSNTSKHNSRSNGPRKPLPKSRKQASTKSAVITRLVSRAKGANMAELQAATGWQPHSVRAALSGMRKRGATVTLSQSAKGASVYRLSAEQ